MSFCPHGRLHSCDECESWADDWMKEQHALDKQERESWERLPRGSVYLEDMRPDPEDGDDQRLSAVGGETDHG